MQGDIFSRFKNWLEAWFYSWWPGQSPIVKPPPPPQQAPPPAPVMPPPTPAPVPPTAAAHLSMLRQQALNRWLSSKLTPATAANIEAAAKKIIQYKQEYYEPAAAKSGVPWYVIGALDCRESDFDHSAYLGNGDPLSRPTTHVPAGRGPFASWALGAADSLTLNNWNVLSPGTTWSIDTILLACEEWNGIGYRERGMPSPYVWAGTNIQVRGKYVGDGQFDPNAWDTQPGVAALLLSLIAQGAITIG